MSTTMNLDTASTIEVVDRFVITGRYREYMALVRASGGRILYSSGWDRSKRLVEERAKQAQHELSRQERRRSDAERLSYAEALECRIEIEEHPTDFGPAYRARVRKTENGIAMYETDWCAESTDAENLARAYMRRMLRLARSDLEYNHESRRSS